jgi:DNA primase
MTGRIPQDVLDRVMAAHDIVEVVGRYLPLRKAGRAHKALCPFHDEKTPSFTVNPDRQSFKCFGCGKGGNVFGFLMAKEGMQFPEAVRALAAEKQIPVPDSFRRDAGEQDSRLERIRAALALAQDLYVRTLASEAGASARRYLEQRGFPAASVVEFGLGLSPARWDGLIDAARAKGVPPSVLEDAGLCLRRESGSGFYDRFRGRLMFPVRDMQGRVVTYGARALLPDDQPKYLNGPETPVFRKGKTLYGLDRAKEAIRRERCAVLCEGYTDVLMADVFGFRHVVAGMGTAFTPDQARLLHRLTDLVVLLYDGDQAGRLAAEKSLDVLLDEGLEVRIALLPEGKDVDEVLLEEGPERLTRVVSGAKDLFDFKYDALAARLDLSTVRGRATAADDLVQSARRVKNVIERDLLFRRIAERLGADEKVLRARAAEPDRAASRRAAPSADPPEPGETPLDRDVRLFHERLVAGALFRPERLPDVRAALPPEDVRAAGLSALWRGLLALVDDGEAPHVEALARRVAADPGASEALAGLPEDVDFDEWLPDALEGLAARRAARERRDATLSAFRSLAPSVPGAGPGPGRDPGSGG